MIPPIRTCHTAVKDDVCAFKLNKSNIMLTSEVIHVPTAKDDIHGVSRQTTAQWMKERT